MQKTEYCMTEIWKDIKDFEGLYQVSTWGRVKSLWFNKERILRPKNNGNGYLCITLFKDGTQQTRYIHRLVAEAFIPNPDNLPQVNHKDENKENNYVENLEWCDGKYNSNYGTLKQRCSAAQKGEKSHMYGKHLSEETRKKISDKQNKKPVVSIQNNKLIKIYPSLKSVEKNGFFKNAVWKCCQGRQNTHLGFQWMYLSDYEKMFGQLN